MLGTNLRNTYARCLFRYLNFSWCSCVNVRWVATMSDYKWCHGPKCHKSHTQDRIRGSKGSKVLRTKKVKTTDRGIELMAISIFVVKVVGMTFFLKYAPQCMAIAPRHRATRNSNRYRNRNKARLEWQ